MLYAAVLLFKSEMEQEPYSPIFEERFFLIDALGEEEALIKAKQLGVKKTLHQNGLQGQTTKWRLVNVVDIQELIDQKLMDGTELYYRYFDDLDAYKKLEFLAYKKY